MLMRRIERVCGVLAGILGLAALLVTLTQGAIIVHENFAVLRIATFTADQLAIATSVGVTTLGALFSALGAVQDTRRGMADRRYRRVRGVWTALVVVSALLCAVGVYLLDAKSVWVTLGGSPPMQVGDSIVSASLLFAPATLMSLAAAVVAVLAKLAALLSRGHAPALG